MGVLKDVSNAIQSDTLSVRIKYVDILTGEWQVEFYQCLTVAYIRYEFLKKMCVYVELGVMVNDYYIWLFKWGEYDTQN